VLVNQGRTLVDYYLEVAEHSGDPKAACNWVTQDVLRVLGDEGATIEAFPIPAAELANLVNAIREGNLPNTRAREAFNLMRQSRLDVATAIAQLGIQKVDESELIALVKDLLAANPKTIADIRAGKLQAAGALIGQAKKRNANVDPNRVRELSIELAQQGES
jgi:aspartyl-tRNA(Asn)/glutamyl-tRNA(Gln) amidotransferase subunit B